MPLSPSYLYLHYEDQSVNFVLDKEMVDSENHTVDQIVGVIDAKADDL